MEQLKFLLPPLLLLLLLRSTVVADEIKPCSTPSSSCWKLEDVEASISVDGNLVKISMVKDDFDPAKEKVFWMAVGLSGGTEMKDMFVVECNVDLNKETGKQMEQTLAWSDGLTSPKKITKAGMFVTTAQGSASSILNDGVGHAAAECSFGFEIRKEITFVTEEDIGKREIKDSFYVNLAVGTTPHEKHTHSARTEKKEEIEKLHIVINKDSKKTKDGGSKGSRVMSNNNTAALLLLLLPFFLRM